MSVYMTEEEQIEALKKWWKKYSNTIIITFSLILLVLAGYKYWNWNRENTQLLASNTYEHMMFSFSNQESDKVKSYANKLIDDYSGTIYADVAHLTLAKQFIDKGEVTQGKEELQHVINQGNTKAIKQIASIRLARVLLSEKKYNQALKQLEDVKYESFQPMISELRGDIYAATGKYPQAYTAYKEAIAAAQSQGIGNLFLELKTSELAAVTHSLIKSNNQTQTA